MWLLPQLWTDLLTWALSVYQQTAQAAVDTTSTDDVSTVQMMQANRVIFRDFFRFDISAAFDSWKN